MWDENEGVRYILEPDDFICMGDCRLCTEECNRRDEEFIDD